MHPLPEQKPAAMAFWSAERFPMQKQSSCRRQEGWLWLVEISFQRLLHATSRLFCSMAVVVAPPVSFPATTRASNTAPFLPLGSARPQKLVIACSGAGPSPGNSS